MTDKQPRQYGPVAWSESMRERIYKIIGKNDDEPANEKIVDGWVSNFEKLSGRFRDDLKSLISGLK